MPSVTRSTATANYNAQRHRYRKSGRRMLQMTGLALKKTQRRSGPVDLQKTMFPPTTQSSAVAGVRNRMIRATFMQPDKNGQ